MKMDKKRKMGYLLTILGGTCWACSGACGQFLFENRGLDANWVVTMRLLLAGLLLSAYSVGRWRSRAVDVFRSAKSIGALLVLGVLAWRCASIPISARLSCPMRLQQLRCSTPGLYWSWYGWSSATSACRAAMS